MNYSSKYTALVLGATAMLATGPVLAHTGPGSHDSFLAGFFHVFGGADHLLGMLAAGIWVARRSAGARRGIVALAGIALASGIAVGLAAGKMSMMETGIALTILVTGGMIAMGRLFGERLGAAIIVTMALLHGFAHGSELPLEMSVLSFAAGVLVASGLLVGTGQSMANWAAKAVPRALPAAGTCLAVLGVGMLVG